MAFASGVLWDSGYSCMICVSCVDVSGVPWASEARWKANPSSICI